MAAWMMTLQFLPVALGFSCSAAYTPASSALGAGFRAPARASALRAQLVGAGGEELSSGTKPQQSEQEVAEMAQKTEMLGAMTEGDQIISKDTYGLMLSTLLKAEAKDIAAQISTNYAMVDYGFLQKLEEAIADPDETHKERLIAIKESTTAEMAKRMQSAMEAMKELVQSPTPVVMEGKIAALARQGRLDDALLQLLQANLEQAKAAGEAGAGAANVIGRLQARVQTELDQALPKEVALLRRLLRMDDAEARQKLLREKMAPKRGAGSSGIILNTLGKEEQEDAKNTEPDVSPRAIAEAIKDIKLRFGNIDEEYDSGFVKQLETISDEAEAIALDLAGGKQLTSRQAQDMAWDQASVSVWDLEQVEEEAHQEGKLAVWEDEAQEQMARQDSAMRKAAVDTDWADNK